jgi:hypothetical protein
VPFALGVRGIDEQKVRPFAPEAIHVFEPDDAVFVIVFIELEIARVQNTGDGSGGIFPFKSQRMALKRAVPCFYKTHTQVRSQWNVYAGLDLFESMNHFASFVIARIIEHTLFDEFTSKKRSINQRLLLFRQSESGF